VEPARGKKRAKNGRRPGVALAGIGVGLFVLVLYLWTLAPTVLSYPEELDAPVLPASACVLGIPQAPGYPTYMLLTHLFTYLPVGDVAYRVNLASALFGALAVVAVFLLGFVISRRIVAGLVGALGFGTSGLLWSQAVIAEVYTLNAFFVALTILVLLFWRERRKDGYLLVVAFLMGLSMTNHLTSGLLLPAGLLFVLLVERRKLLEWGLVLKGIGFSLLGLLPYVYLPLRARMEPPINVGDPSSRGRFLDLVSGAQFKEDMFIFGPGELVGRLYAYLENLSGQFHWAFVMATLVGALYLLWQDRAAFALLGSLYLGWLFYALEYDITDIEAYYIPTCLIFAVFAAVGLGILLREAEALAAPSSPKVRGIALVTLSVLALAVPLLSLGETYRAVDQSANYEGRRIIELVDRNVEPGATVLQLRSPLYYASLVEGRREDIKLVHYFEPQNTEEPQEEEEKADSLDAAARGGSLYLLFPGEYTLYWYEEAGYRPVPVEEDTLYRVLSPTFTSSPGGSRET